MGILILNDYHHHPQYKVSGLIYTIDRLLNIPLSNNNCDELNLIKQTSKEKRV